MPSPASRITPKLACGQCRDRKVKCDHKTPICSTCLRHGFECYYPERKRPVRQRNRISYPDLAQRLVQMERLVEELKDNVQRPKKVQNTVLDEARLHGVESTRRTSIPNFGRPAGTRSLISKGVARQNVLPVAPEVGAGSAASYSMFSSQGIRKINNLTGDTSFGDFIQNLKRQTFKTWENVDLDGPDRPLPSNDMIVTYLNDFLSTQNRDIRLFEEHEVRAATYTYMNGRNVRDSSWYMAINIILAHSIRKSNKMRNPDEYEGYLMNAMKQISRVMLKTPTVMEVGALLSMVLYFVFNGQNHVAVRVMGVVSQPIILQGFHCNNHALPPEKALHRRRLFWQAYTIDHDLMFRIGKSPLISDDLLTSLPDEHPVDGYSLYYYPNNISFNFLYEQVRIARIQGKIYSLLYSVSSNIFPSELGSRISQLDEELQQWRETIPELIRPEPCDALNDMDFHRLMCLTTLHFLYFQLVVAIHSVAFRFASTAEGHDYDIDGIMPSVALCVGAARASLSLLTYHQVEHPFTTFLLHQVAWSVDILFISILQNIPSSRAARDLDLICRIVSSFERYDPNHQSDFTYHLVRGLAGVLSNALHRATLHPPDSDSMEEQPILPVWREGNAGIDRLSETSDLDMQPILPETGINKGGETESTMGKADSGQWALDNIEGLLQSFNLYDLSGKVAMVVPHNHNSQDLLVALLQELQRLARHTVPHKVGDQVVPKELWLLTLVRPSVFATRNPETCPPEDYRPWASVAAQWIIYAGDALYELCKKEITTDIGRQKWTLSLWDECKARFEVATSEKFDCKTRTFAWAALGEMGEAESSGVTTNVAASFGLTSTEE